MQKKATTQIERRIDTFVGVTGALIPVGLVVGNIGFETLVAATGLFWICRCIIAKKNPLPDLIRHPLILPWMLWFGCVMLSLILNGPGSKGWAHDVSLVRYPLFALAMIDTSFRRPVVRYCIYGLAAGVLLAAINTLFAYAIGFDLLGKPLVRYTGKLKEAGRIAGLSAYAGPFFLAWALIDKRLSPKTKWIITAIGLIAVAQVFQIRIRTAIIAMAAGILPILFMGLRKRFSVLTTIGISIFLIASVAIVFYFQKMGSLNSLYDRFYIWKVSAVIWRDHPWFGAGVSAFQDVFAKISASGSVAGYIEPSGRIHGGSRMVAATHAHNMILMLLSTTGIAGLTAFGWLFINAVRTAFQKLDGWRWGLITFPFVIFGIGLTGFNIYHGWYQSLVAYILVLIGISAHPGELSKFYTT